MSQVKTVGKMAPFDKLSAKGDCLNLRSFIVKIIETLENLQSPGQVNGHGGA